MMTSLTATGAIKESQQRITTISIEISKLCQHHSVDWLEIVQLLLKI